ncbi:RUS family member 1-like isoform X2 [Penaeus japonicus]|uniref:RUS family member 1-like isoform X2 n=1 Tax=Penaeus japonicus TaxID=27405 RepID=UPI001C70DF40|nr:RUS family member 1-like isoform X2 [Penaeus japonicus]XP_042881741.1 RUS family member 1-like isoform X2 [Penaeus japonicus]
MKGEEAILYQEKKGALGVKKNYVYQESTRSFVPLECREDDHDRSERHVVGWLRDVFLPKGYPDSVSPDYLQYQMWDTIQAYCSSIAGALSLRATFEGLGVGEGAATTLAATLTWLLKDGSGMIASIAFAYWRGSQLDCNSKQWRLFADVANDTGHFLRLLGPLLPVPFLAVMCVSAVMMALVGVAGGATRAALTLHQARRDNMADVSAKDGSQETLVNLAALITSLTILPLITSNFLLTWVTFILCVVFHLLANYQAVRSVKMESLNRPRLLYILDKWTMNASVPGIDETNLSEPLLTGAAFIPDFFPFGFRVRLGCSFNRALNQCKSSEENMKEFYLNIMEAFRMDNYVVCGKLAHRQIFITYRQELTTQQELEAFFVAYLCILNFVHVKEGVPLSAEFVAEGLSRTTEVDNIIPLVKRHAQRLFPSFQQELSAKGWNIHRLHLAAGEWRLA